MNKTIKCKHYWHGICSYQRYTKKLCSERYMKKGCFYLGICSECNKLVDRLDFIFIRLGYFHKKCLKVAKKRGVIRVGEKDE